MTFITRLCLLGILLSYTTMCFGRNMHKVNQISHYDIDDYGEPGPNPGHDPQNPPPPPPRGKQISQYDTDDYAEPGPNPGHDPHNPPPSPPPSQVYPKMQISVDNNERI
ncbi:hypothetical protein P8452_19734 [Trifolium repens]|nr:hypothetical protein P8452_19734 [Trifolium repens]